MNIYFDTEFTGLHKYTTLISIGLISEDGRTFYAEFLDYDKTQCNDWIKDNVLSNLVYSTKDWDTIADVKVKGNKFKIANELKSWLESFNEDIQLVSDCSHYDMVLFVDLFGNAFNIPECVCPACYDINVDIANKLCDGDIKLAFNLSREYLLEQNGIEIEGSKHNSLYDAKVIKAIHNILK